MPSDISQRILKDYLEELIDTKHFDSIPSILGYLSENYQISPKRLEQIKNLLFFLQMMYFATDDIIDEGNEIDLRIKHLLRLHYSTNKFYTLILQQPPRIRSRILTIYDKTFNEMLKVPTSMMSIIKAIYEKRVPKGSLISLLSQLQILRAKHVAFYWVVALAFFEKDTNKIFLIASEKVKERAILLIKKDLEDMRFDRQTGSFNIYNTLHDLGYTKSNDDINTLIIEVINRIKAIPPQKIFSDQSSADDTKK